MNYQELAEKVILGYQINTEEALKIISISDEETNKLLTASDKIRRHFKGNQVKLCSIINAKSGRCSENCSFCAQSAHHKTDTLVYPLMTEEEIVTSAAQAEKNMSATCFSIVTSGKALHTEPEIKTVETAINRITNETKLNRCVSMGILSREDILKLKSAGLTRLHHNLETAESFFSKICTTHTYAERIKTVQMAKEAGLEVCSGGIFNLGETLEQRIELAMELRALEIQSIPINILNPILGTPAYENQHQITPFEVLRLVATYRFILPSADIGVFGGREKALGEFQPLMFMAGANVTLIGDYLTTKGQAIDKDLQMIANLGLEIDARIH